MVYWPSDNTIYLSYLRHNNEVCLQKLTCFDNRRGKLHIYSSNSRYVRRGVGRLVYMHLTNTLLLLNVQNWFVWDFVGRFGYWVPVTYFNSWGATGISPIYSLDYPKEICWCNIENKQMRLLWMHLKCEMTIHSSKWLCFTIQPRKRTFAKDSVHYKRYFRLNKSNNTFSVGNIILNCLEEWRKTGIKPYRIELLFKSSKKILKYIRTSSRWINKIEMTFLPR